MRAGLFIIYAGLSIASLIAFCVEMSVSQCARTLRLERRAQKNKMLRREIRFINEYEQFRRKWHQHDVDKSRQTRLNRLRSYDLIVEWHEIVSDRVVSDKSAVTKDALTQLPTQWYRPFLPW